MRVLVFIFSFWVDISNQSNACSLKWIMQIMAWATWIIAIFNISVGKTWSLIFSLSHFLTVFVHVVLLASVLNKVLIKENLIELLKFCNLFSGILGLFPGLSFQMTHHLLTLINDYSRHTWVYFMETKQRLLTFCVCSNPCLKNNLESLSNVCGQRIAENTSATHLKTIVPLKVFNCNILCLIVAAKWCCWKIKPYLRDRKMYDPCKRPWPTVFGLKQ